VNQAAHRDTGHSVFQRLLNLARIRGEDFNLTLSRYAVERLLYRLSISQHSSQFVLKGASLFLVWSGQNYRATRDADLLGYGDSDPSSMAAVFRQLCDLAPEADDGIIFRGDSIMAEPIREEQEYDGVRVKLEALLHTAKIPVQVDIGFGDAITPSADEVDFPTLLPDLPAPHLRAYPRYTMVAEKLEAVVRLGMANSRMKDFYDLWLVSRLFDFDGATLSRALRNTLDRRATALKGALPTALTSEFHDDRLKRTQWRAFVRRSRPDDAPAELEPVVRVIAAFLAPIIKALHGAFSTTTALATRWSLGLTLPFCQRGAQAAQRLHGKDVRLSAGHGHELKLCRPIYEAVLVSQDGSDFTAGTLH
jgi:hypothetical protein